MPLRPSHSEPEAFPVFEHLPSPTHDLGSIQVVRALPVARRRSVGPWVFLDGFGPSERLMVVGAHPHIGIATLTWLFSGSILHRDSLGSEQVVAPGEVSLMTAGRGLCHTETGVDGPLHGVQLWLSLPPAERRRVPAYHHYSDLPSVEEAGGVVKVVVGRYQGFGSPVRTFQPTVLLDVRVDGSLDVTMDYELEHGFFVTEGELRVDGNLLRAGDFVYLGMRGYGVQAVGEGRMVVVGGEPIEQPYVLWWNFLADDIDTIRWAREAWNTDDGEFGAVPGAKRLLAPSIPGEGT